MFHLGAAAFYQVVKIQYIGPVEPAQTYKRIVKTLVICIPVRYIHIGAQVSGDTPEGVY